MGFIIMLLLGFILPFFNMKPVRTWHFSADNFLRQICLAVQSYEHNHGTMPNSIYVIEDFNPSESIVELINHKVISTANDIKYNKDAKDADWMLMLNRNVNGNSIDVLCDNSGNITYNRPTIDLINTSAQQVDAPEPPAAAR